MPFGVIKSIFLKGDWHRSIIAAAFAAAAAQEPVVYPQRSFVGFIDVILHAMLPFFLWSKIKCHFLFTENDMQKKT